jgi:methionyl-tRNA synthetase
LMNVARLGNKYFDEEPWKLKIIRVQNMYVALQIAAALSSLWTVLAFHKQKL